MRLVNRVMFIALPEYVYSRYSCISVYTMSRQNR